MSGKDGVGPTLPFPIDAGPLGAGDFTVEGFLPEASIPIRTSFTHTEQWLLPEGWIDDFKITKPAGEWHRVVVGGIGGTLTVHDSEEIDGVLFVRRQVYDESDKLLEKHLTRADLVRG